MTATDTYLLLRAFCEELARCGMEHACTSPGSRNTPLILSLAREPGIRTWSHIDERCGAFFALGAAKASGRPVAVTTTSGTAAANLMPAVIEAHHARVPLIVLTADRPPELREIGAGQTIDQLKLYGDAVKWFFEVGVHEATPERLRWIRTLACRAYWTAAATRPGPVHLNFPLREPLVLDEPLPPDDTARGERSPYVSFDAPPQRTPMGGQHPFGRTVIVAGGLRGADAGERLAAFAAQARIPLLADPLSGARRGPAAIAHYDLLLREPQFAASQRPQFVLRVGDLPTSKPLRAWLGGLTDMAQIAIDPDLTWQDPGATVGLRVAAPFTALLDGLATGEIEPAPNDWLASWRAADDAASDAIAEALEADGTISEPLVASRLGEWLSEEATVVVASSMPIRDAEAFFPARSDPPRTLSSRGANGIDGTVSAAFGAAAVTAGRVVLLIGDVALAHDVGGLLAASRLGLELTIVLLNNDGGGIFHFLPVSREGDAFEQHVATPLGLDFGEVAKVYGLRHERPATLSELRGALNGTDATIVELRTDRRHNLDLHRRIEAAVVEAVSRLAPAAAPRA